MNKKIALAAVTAALAFMPSSANAHVSAAAGPWSSNTTQEVAFNIGHGCSGSDTYKLTIDLPAGITSVRPMPSDFGKVSVIKDTAGAVTSVTWQRADGDVLDSDIAFYKVVIRMKTPDKPFTTLYFPAHQVCRKADGTILPTVDWVGLPSDPAPPDGGKAPEPAASINLLPPRVPGWNKYTAPAAISDLSVFFKDAQIVWKGAQAYSANPNTVAQIKVTAGASPLTALAAGDEFWVKY